MSEHPMLYQSIPAGDLLSRGRFLCKYWLSTDEMKLGLAYLTAAAAKGKIEAASALIETAEREWARIPQYDELIRDTACAAVVCCECAEDGISFLEKLVVYGSKADFLSALSILKAKRMTRDPSVTKARMLIAEYAVTGSNTEEMLEACRQNLDCYMIHRFYHSFFSIRPKNKAHFDCISPPDARILLTHYEKHGEDPEPLLNMIRQSKSPHRLLILEEYEREKRLQAQRSQQLRSLFEKETEEMNLGFLIRDMILSFSGSLDEEEEEE